MRAIAVALVLLPGCVYSTSRPMSDTGYDIGPCGILCAADGDLEADWACCERLAGWTCVNIRNGPTTHCGGCGIECAAGEACRDGVCVTE